MREERERESGGEKKERERGGRGGPLGGGARVKEEEREREYG